MKMSVMKDSKTTSTDGNYELEIPEFRLSEKGAKALAMRLNNPPPPSERLRALFKKDEFRMDLPDKPFSKEILALAKRVVEAQGKARGKDGKMTDEMIAKAADWIMNCPLGEE